MSRNSRYTRAQLLSDIASYCSDAQYADLLDAYATLDNATERILAIVRGTMPRLTDGRILDGCTPMFIRYVDATGEKPNTGTVARIRTLRETYSDDTEFRAAVIRELTRG